MSEVKGTLLTIILALSVFGMVFAIVTGAIKDKADEVTQQVKDAGKMPGSEDDKSGTTPEKLVTYHF